MIRLSVIAICTYQIGIAESVNPYRKEKNSTEAGISMGNVLSIPLLQKKGAVPEVLFLTTRPPEEIKAEWPYYQNWFIPQMIRERGAVVQLRSWRDPDLDPASISTFKSVSFLWCNEYDQQPKEFSEFVRNVLVPAQQLNPILHIFNDPRIILWNLDKHYLLELAKAGYRVPWSEFVDMGQHTHASQTSTIEKFSESKPLVLKPAISGTARNTHLINNPRAFTLNDIAFLDHVLIEGANGGLILQQYEERISSGEYSLIFVNGTHTILTKPQAGEYRCQGEFGGSTKEIAMVEFPRCAVDAAQQIWKLLESKAKKPNIETGIQTSRGLVYARIDGIVKDDTFILMEVEAIEPHLWLETKSGSGALEQICKVFIPNGP